MIIIKITIPLDAPSNTTL